MPLSSKFWWQLVLQKTSSFEQSYTLQGYMLLVFNTHFKKDDVKMRPRYVYRLYFYFFFHSQTLHWMHIHYLYLCPTLVLVSLPLSQVRGIGLRNFNVLSAGITFKITFNTYRREGVFTWLSSLDACQFTIANIRFIKILTWLLGFLVIFDIL